MCQLITKTLLSTAVPVHLTYWNKKAKTWREQHFYNSNVLGEYAIHLKNFGGNDKKTALGTYADAGMDI